MSRPRVVVVGGGVTGLATAWHLRDVADVTVLEAADRVGGQILTVDVAGAPLDVGADAFLAREPEGVRLLRAAGFDDADLLTPATGQVHLWVRGRLRPLPGGTVLGVPTDPVAVLRSGALGVAGAARAALEPLLPRRRVVGDRSVEDLVGERFGRAVVDGLVEPLLSGVYAGSAAHLSVQAAAPPVWEAARRRSLTDGLQERRRAAPAAGPVFVTLAGGLGRLVDRLRDVLGDRVLTSRAVTGLHRSDAGWEVVAGDATLPADDVVLAVPAAAAATLLDGAVPDAARELRGVRTASVAVVALAYDRTAAAGVPPGSGFLVPRTEGRVVKAATWSSRKWSHHARRDRFVLRASVGRVDDAGPLGLDDEVLAALVDAEVRWASGITAPAVERRVVRWPDALPQYEIGHVARVDRIRAAAASAGRGLHLGGAALDGVGLTARAREAERLAEAVRSAAQRRGSSAARATAS